MRRTPRRRAWAVDGEAPLRPLPLALIALGTLATGARADPPRPGMSLAFADEFDGPALDPRWATTFPDGKRALDREMQTYRDAGPGPSPFRFADGVLAIMASQPEPGGDGSYASGMLSSHASYSFRYGYAEVRARVPAGKGLWPAFWLFRTDGNAPGAPYGEIDVLELLGAEPGLAYATLHAGPQWEGRKIEQATSTADPPYSAGFHTFAVDWREDETVFSVDGTVTGRFPTPPEAKGAMHLILNLAVGGPWGGPPDAGTAFPAAFEVDYVRVWRDPEP